MRFFRLPMLRRFLGVVLTLGLCFGTAESGMAEVHDGDGVRAERLAMHLAHAAADAHHAASDRCALATTIGVPHGHEGPLGSGPADHPTSHVCHDTHAHGWVAAAAAPALTLVQHREPLELAREPAPSPAPRSPHLRPPIA